MGNLWFGYKIWRWSFINIWNMNTNFWPTNYSTVVESDLHVCTWGEWLKSFNECELKYCNTKFNKFTNLQLSLSSPMWPLCWDLHSKKSQIESFTEIWWARRCSYTFTAGEFVSKSAQSIQLQCCILFWYRFGDGDAANHYNCKNDIMRQGQTLACWLTRFVTMHTHWITTDFKAYLLVTTPHCILYNVIVHVGHPLLSSLHPFQHATLVPTLDELVTHKVFNCRHTRYSYSMLTYRTSFLHRVL